jgi:hypothetical protein
VSRVDRLGQLTKYELNALENSSVRAWPEVKEARVKFDLAHRQAEQLSALRPAHKERYQEQLAKALMENRAEVIACLGWGTFRAAINAGVDDQDDSGRCPHCGGRL